MSYEPSPQEIEQDCDNLIDKICSALITQEEYCLRAVNFIEGQDPIFEHNRPNFKALNHITPLLDVSFIVGMKEFGIIYNKKFIGVINYWRNIGTHFITKTHNIDTGEKTLRMNTIVQLDSFLKQIKDLEIEQIRRFEKVLFSFET